MRVYFYSSTEILYDNYTSHISLSLSVGAVQAMIVKPRVFAFFLYQNGVSVQKRPLLCQLMSNVFNVVSKKASTPKQTPLNVLV